MWKLISLILPVIVLLPAYAFPQTTFEKTYGGSGEDGGNSVYQTTDGGYIVAGWTESYGAGLFDAYLIKTDPSGEILWTRTFGGASPDSGSSVIQTQDGGYIITGSTKSFSQTGWPDVYLIKTDPAGDSLWTRYYGSFGIDVGTSVQENPDGGYSIAGFTHSSGAGEADVYSIRTDSSGDTLWTRTYGGAWYDRAYSMQQTTDGGYILAGMTASFGAGSYDVYLIKTDSSGDTLWTRTYGNNGDNYGYSVQQTPDGGYVLAGATPGPGIYDVYLIKTDAEGDSLWTRTYDFGGLDGAYSVRRTLDGGYVVAGLTGTYELGDSFDVLLFKTDSSGDILWTRTYGGPDYEEGLSVQQTSDGGYIIAGRTESFGAGDYDVYLIKTDPDGLVGIGGDEQDPITIPRSLLLSQNYPNPFNPSTTISFEIPDLTSERQDVSLTIYDLRGRLIRRLVDSRLEPGRHRLVWDGKDGGGERVPSGVYLYTLRANGGASTRKMMVLK